MPGRRRTCPASPVVALAAGLALADESLGVTAAAALQITLPTLIAVPGSIVDIPIDATPGPQGLGIFSVDFRLTLDPAVIQSSQSLADGFLQTWGPPFVNATPGFVAVATAGATPVASSGTLLNTLRLTINPGAVVGTDMPLAFEHVRFNEGTPSVAVTNGVLRIRAGVGVGVGIVPAFALAPLAPNPVTRAARLAFTLPAGGTLPVTLGIYSVSGRRVRTLLSGELGPGSYTTSWDLRDEAGAPVAAGLYFVRLANGPEHRDQRVVVCR